MELATFYVLYKAELSVVIPLHFFKSFPSLSLLQLHFLGAIGHIEPNYRTIVHDNTTICLLLA
jgi:hypothetical protein